MNSRKGRGLCLLEDLSPELRLRNFECESMHDGLTVIIPPAKDSIMLQKLQEFDQVITLETIGVRFECEWLDRPQTVDEEFTRCNVWVHTDINQRLEMLIPGPTCSCIMQCAVACRVEGTEIVDAFQLQFTQEYTFFQFTRNDTALEAGVRLLPFIILMIFAVIGNGAILSTYGYYMPWYTLGGLLCLTGGALMYTVDTETSVARVYSYSITIGLGVGLFAQASFSVAQAIVDPNSSPQP
jgi:hypothetical protein